MIKHLFTRQVGHITVNHFPIRSLLYATILAGACIAMLLLLAPSQAWAAGPCSDPSCQTGSDYANNGSSNPKTGSLEIPLGTSSLLAFTDPKYTVDAPGIGVIWLGTVSIVDAFMVFMFILTAIRVMISGSVFRYADVAEAVPRMLLALIAAHISFAIIGFFLGLNNALCTSILEYAGAVVHPSTKVSDMLGFGKMDFSIWDMVTGGISYVLRVLILVILFLVKLVMILMLFAQLIVRIFLIDLYIIFSAPCIACSALPGRSGQPITRMWLQGFLSLVFVQLVQVGGLIVAELAVGLLTNSLTSMIRGVIPSWLGFATNDLNSVVSSFFGIIILWFILKVPGLLQAAPMQTISAGGAMVGSMATSVAGGAAGAAVIAAK